MKKLRITGYILLLLVALALIFNQQIKDFTVGWLGQNRNAQVTKTTIAKSRQVKGEFDFSKVKSIDTKQVAAAALNRDDVGTLGKIAIPAVNLSLPILKGLSDTALSTGAGTMKADQTMGQGNYALAGHYMTNKGILFSPIADTQLGEKIYITDLSQVYTYQIDVKKVVDPTQVSIIDDVPGKKMITLITCADGGANRWSVQGELVKVQKATKKSLAVFNS